jgi:DNA-binding NarL/FixJ family response regulator
MGVTILIVDDNPRLRALIRRLLVREPDLHIVGEAANGPDAILMAHQLQPDIVLMDLVMPRLSGLEAMRRIKMDRPATKVIITTVHSENAYLKAAEASGTDAFLIKKTLMTTLVPTIWRLLGCMSPPNTP